MFRFTDLIIFQLTRDCNLKCDYCLMIEKHKYKNEVIDYNKYKKIIDTIIEQRVLNNRKDLPLNLNFHGGEVTLVNKKNFFKFADYAYNAFSNAGLNFSLGLQTNGVLFDDEFMKIINRYNMSVGLSWDGFGDANSFRLKNGDNILKKRVEEFEKNHITYGIMPVVHKKNIDSIDDFKEFAKSKGATYRTNYVEDPYKNENSEFEVPGSEYYKKIILPALEKEARGKDGEDQTVEEMINNCLFDMVAVYEKSERRGCWGKYCGAGINMMGVHPDGSMGYCDRWTTQSEDSFIQNALDYDFLGIYQLRKTIDINLEKHKLLNKFECDTCPAESFCSYGCMSFYYSKHGEYGIDEDKVCNVSLPFYYYVRDNFDNIAKNWADEGRELKIYDFYNFINVKKDILKNLRKNNLTIKRKGPGLFFEYIKGEL